MLYKKRLIIKKYIFECTSPILNSGVKKYEATLTILTFTRNPGVRCGCGDGCQIFPCLGGNYFLIYNSCNRRYRCVEIKKY